MAPDAGVDPAPAPALADQLPGILIQIGSGPLQIDIAPSAGGRIAQIRHSGVEQLIGYTEGEAGSAMIAWGCFPMLPWAGRIRHGRFHFDDRAVELPINLPPHAIHGLGFALPWRVEAHSRRHAELSLQLPSDGHWPFAGLCRHHIEAGDNWLRMQLSVTAQAQAMPAVLGWHPWFVKPDRIGFCPRRMYPRDAEGVAVEPTTSPTPGPWDDCFINERPVLLHRGDRMIRLTSNCRHWVVYDEPSHSTCFEPQTGPPDAFNNDSPRLEPGASLSAWFLLEWT